MNSEKNNETNSKSGIVKLIVFGALFFGMLVIFSAMMTPTKWFDDKRIQNRNARTVQMMEQPPYTIDIINIGDSLSTAGFTPMELWRQNGFTSFNIGSDGIRMPEAYYAIVESCNRQAPKYLLMESLFMFRYSATQDFQMLLSQPLYHRFAFLKYHSIWKPFIEGRGVMIYHRGYTVNENVGGYEGDPEYLDLDLEGNDRVEVPAFNRMWFQRIKKFCAEKGIKIIIYSMPSPANYNWDRIEGLEKFAEEEGVEYLDLNQRAAEIGIDWEWDTNDGGDHMNLTGATKVAAFMGKYLSSKEDLTDHRGDPAYQDWDEEIVEYDRLVKEMEGKSFQDIKDEQIKQKKEEKKRAEELKQQQQQNGN